MHPFAPLSLVVALAWAGSASAQSAPAAAASAPSDRAQRDADKVFRMILMHADKPRRAAARDDKAAAPAPGASPAGRPAPPARPTAEAAATPAKPAEPVAAAPAAVPPAVVVTAAPAATAPVADTRPVDTPATATTAAPLAAAAPSPALAALPEPTVPKNTKLELIQSEEPVFPSRLVRQLGNGSVVVRFDVRPDGTVSQPEVVQSSHRGLNAAALAAVSAWRFKPISEAAPGIVELKFE
jgi:TonB family protein